MPKWVKDENKWNKAKDIVKKEYNISEDNNEDFYKLVGGIYKRMSKEAIYKQASNKKLQGIEDVFKGDPIAKEVAYMMANSHEYKEPNVKGAISFVKNYKWEKDKIDINRLQGINKPIIDEKVDNIAKSIKEKGTKPLITVNQLHGIRPQTSGKRILFDGHHRLEALKKLGRGKAPIYRGTYNGGTEKSIDDLVEKKASYKEEIYKQARTKTKSKSKFSKLQENKVPLTEEERKIVEDKKATWSDGNSAIFKSINPKTGEKTYATHTHRAYNTSPTLKGAIGRFHDFIKKTASNDIHQTDLSTQQADSSRQQNIMDNINREKILKRLIDAKKVSKKFQELHWVV